MTIGTSNGFARLALLAAFAVAVAIGCQSAPPKSASSGAAGQETFLTARDAADALIEAAADWDVSALREILGPDGQDLIATKDPVQDKARAAAFAERAREKKELVVDPKNPGRATLLVGANGWPLPIPIVESQGRWRFDTAAGRDEIMRRRIGANELDAITVCRGYVEAQEEYASQIHDHAGVHQYAQRIISTPGKRDGLAWKNPDGSFGGPVGEAVANAIAEGYGRGEPFHGYYFKVLTGQGPAARLGTLSYLVDGAMIGGFALVAWPAEYGVTGVQTFIVSYDGVVYQKDLGPTTGTVASRMELYNPDPTWRATEDDWR